MQRRHRHHRSSRQHTRCPPCMMSSRDDWCNCYMLGSSTVCHPTHACVAQLVLAYDDRPNSCWHMMRPMVEPWQTSDAAPLPGPQVLFVSRRPYGNLPPKQPWPCHGWPVMHHATLVAKVTVSCIDHNGAAYLCPDAKPTWHPSPPQLITPTRIRKLHCMTAQCRSLCAGKG
jgi:hypothetical protein